MNHFLNVFFFFFFRGLFFEKHLKFIQLNEKLVKFTEKDLSYLKKVGIIIAAMKPYSCKSANSPTVYLSL